MNIFTQTGINNILDRSWGGSQTEGIRLSFEQMPSQEHDNAGNIWPLFIWYNMKNVSWLVLIIMHLLRGNDRFHTWAASLKITGSLRNVDLNSRQTDSEENDWLTHAYDRRISIVTYYPQSKQK